jgi:tetratricopeptide (TPR) repeat protein
MADVEAGNREVSAGVPAGRRWAGATPISRWGAVGIACIGLTVLVACRAPAARATLRDVQLPDLARLDQSVETQIRGTYAALTRIRESPGASEAQLGASYGEFGMLLHAAEYYEAAEPAYLNAQALLPMDPRWPYYLAHLHRSQGNTAQTIALLSRVLELRANDLATLVWLGRAYQDQGDLDKAETLFLKAQSVAPQTLAVLAGLGQVALSRKNFTRAATLFEQGLALDPAAASLHSQIAAAYRGLGNTEQAEAHLKRWRNTEVQVPDPLRQELDLALESGLSYELRGVRLMTDRDPAAAAEFFRRGVDITTGATQLGRSLRHKLGTALFLSGNTEAGIKYFEETVKLEPSGGQDEPSAKAHYSLGVVMASRGLGDEALAHFVKAVAFSPNYLEARLALGDALRRAGRVEAALPHYAETVRSNPRAAEARFGYAMGLVRLRRWVAARDWLLESTRVLPDRPDLAHVLARLLVAAPDDRVRDGQRGLAIIEELFKTFKTTEIGETMAMTMAELGEFRQAVGIQRGVLEAVRQSGVEADVRRVTANLRLYERGQPCRTPWPDDDPIHHPVPSPN